MYGGVRGRKTRVGEKLHRFPPTRLYHIYTYTRARTLYIIIRLLPISHSAASYSLREASHRQRRPVVKMLSLIINDL